MRVLKPFAVALLFTAFLFRSTATAAPMRRFAIALDGSYGTGSFSATSQSSHSLSHTITTAAATTALTISLHYTDISNVITTTGCTFNGVSMTAGSSRAVNATSQSTAQWFYLMNPASGSHTVACTLSGGLGVGSKIGICPSSWTGVDSASPIDASAVVDNGGPGTAVSGDITTVTDGAIAMGALSATNDVASATTTLTEGCDMDPGSVDPYSYTMYTTVASHGTQTMDATKNAGFRWTFAMIALKPQGAAPTIVPPIFGPIKGGGGNAFRRLR